METLLKKSSGNCAILGVRVAFLCLTLFASSFLVCLSPAKAAVPSDFVYKADALLRSRLASGEFSGVVIVAHHGLPILRRPYGLANREWDVPMTLDTEFRIGSTTKQFTAAAILQLSEAGKLSLDDPVSRYVKNVPSSWSAITLRELLCHTSGIPDYVQANGFIRGPARLDLTPEQLVDLVRDKPLEFPPGSRFQYSNTGYVLLGMVIEEVGGQPYAAYLQDHILGPLGLQHTQYDDLSAVVPKRAAGYLNADGNFKNARLMTSSVTFSAGGLRSTADDLLHWDQALHGGKLLRPSSVAAMFTDYGHGYGFGSFVEKRNGHRLWDHGGNLPGFSGAFEQYPDDDLTVIVLTNLEGEGSEKIAKDLAGVYFGWPAGRN